MRVALIVVSALFFTTGCEISQPMPTPEMEEEVTPGSSSVTERPAGKFRCPDDLAAGCKFTTYRFQEEKYYLVFEEHWLRYDFGGEEQLLWWHNSQDVNTIECCYYGGCAYLEVQKREHEEAEWEYISLEICSPAEELPPGYE